MQRYQLNIFGPLLYVVDYLVSHLDHDKFPLLGPSVRPLLSKTQVDFKLRGCWRLATLLAYQTYTAHGNMFSLIPRVYCISQRVKDLD